MISVLAVVGPTASGKTTLAIELASRLQSEIISADSMQVYKGMEIGTAAPTAEERARVKHHLVSFLNPDQPFSAGEFERLARPLVDSLNAQGKTAVVVGGSGLYVRALLDGLFEGPAADERIREQLHAEAETEGVAALYKRLQERDPGYARLIQPNDLRRIVRALEVQELTGRALSSHHEEHRRQVPALTSVQVALDYPRNVLYRRIEARIDRMVAGGFANEVSALVDAGYADALLRLRSLGYRDFAAYLRGEQSLEEAVAAMKMHTRRFARRQLTWFRADPRIHWLAARESDPVEYYVGRVLELLNR